MALLPSIRLLWEFLSDSLGINGFERLIHSTGEWALIFLLLIYAVSPLRRWCSRGMIALAADYGHRLSDWNWLMGLRRALGLLAFFYASSHFLIYFWLELGFSLEEVGYELQERPFIAAGFTSLILLLPLAITSSNAMMRRLKHNWQQLHQLVHLAVIASLLHYLWLSKAGDPAIKFYLLAGGILLLEQTGRSTLVCSEPPLRKPSRNNPLPVQVPSSTSLKSVHPARRPLSPAALDPPY